MFFTFFLLGMLLRHNMTAWYKAWLKMSIFLITPHENPPIDKNRSICNEVV